MKRTAILILLPFVIFTWLFFVLSRKACDSIVRPAVANKIPFIHKTHVNKYGISDCTVCHGYEKNGRFMGIPTVGECTACHARDAAFTGTDHKVPRRKSMFDSYKDTDRPWESWVRQPDLVYFSHKVVMTAKGKDGKLKMKCSSCHGDKANAIDNRMITGKMTMGKCMDCHTALKISNACAVCHD